MIPLLAQLGITLAAGLLQKKAADDEHNRNKANHFAETRASIMDRRAARAGDSGYMQQAINAAKHQPEKPDSGVGNTLAGMGMALLNRQETPDAAPEFQSRGGIEDSSVIKGGWSGGDVWQDEDRYKAYA